MWEELSNYSVNCTCGKCTCGGAKDAEHTMSFLMGLNESFSQIRGQILLMDPIPSLNKIFSLIIQEERQRDIGTNNSTSTLAFNVRGQSNDSNKPRYSSGNQGYKGRKDSVYCTHCNKPGHTHEKCYKLHGFPPGYRTQSRSKNDNRANSISVNDIDTNLQGNVSSINEALTGLTQSQCEQLIAAISGKMASTNLVTTASDCYQENQSHQGKTTQSNTYSDYIQENDWQG